MEWLIARVGVKAAWSIALALLLGGLFSGYVVWNKTVHWWQTHRIESLKDEVDSLKGQVAELQEARRQQEAAAQAAIAAGERNDREIPKARAAAAERAGRAATADRDQRMRDVQATQGDFAAASGGLQGARTR